MTKDEYGDFALRYKGCGACFPMYHTLSRFEKMWFSAIQKDVAELEKENAELKKENQKWKDGISLKDEEIGCIETDFNTFKSKAKEIIKKFSEFVNNDVEYDPEHPQEHTDLWNKLCEEAEQFISEVEK